MTVIARINTLTATKLFGLVINARNHSHLREALSCTLAACQADPTLLHAFVALRISLVTALSHIITVTHLLEIPLVVFLIPIGLIMITESI